VRAALVVGACALVGCSTAARPAPARPGAEEAAPPGPRRGAIAARAPRLTQQHGGTGERLQAVAPVDARVAWASGLGGTVARTTDGGATWRARTVPGAEAMQFRDVHGVSARVAYVLSAGHGDASRIYKTEDGGETWALAFRNDDPKAFFDCFAFWGPDRGLAVADSVDGRWPAVASADGRTWRDAGAGLPPALPGEGALAASGTCVATRGARRAWFATAGGARARVFATDDGGASWAPFDTPIVQGRPNAGAASIAFRDGRHGVLGGGDLAAPDAPLANFARSGDGGRTWRLAARAPFPGSIYGLSYARGRDEAGDERAPPPPVVATGPGGAAWSPDEGDTWRRLEGVEGYWAVAFADEHVGWLVGTGGRVLKLEF
jgi:photosystem II stability/assembly factor-like uncharacterized protein